MNDSTKAPQHDASCSRHATHPAAGLPFDAAGAHYVAAADRLNAKLAADPDLAAAYRRGAEALAARAIERQSALDAFMQRIEHPGEFERFVDFLNLDRGQ